VRLPGGTWAGKPGGNWAGERARAGKLRTGFLKRSRLDGRRGILCPESGNGGGDFLSKGSVNSFGSV
jgi:hypothetical protein